MVISMPKIFVNGQFYFNLSSKMWSHVFFETQCISYGTFQDSFYIVLSEESLFDLILMLRVQLVEQCTHGKYTCSLRYHDDNNSCHSPVAP